VDGIRRQILDGSSDRRRAVVGVLVALVGGAAWFGYSLWRYAYVTVPNAYAVWNTAGHINDFMDAHGGAWPRNWDDFRDTYEGSRRFTADHWDDLKRRVEVDWSANPIVLAEAPEPSGDRPPFRVVWLKDGSDAHFTEPNRLIWNHLRQRRTEHPRPVGAATSQIGQRGSSSSEGAARSSDENTNRRTEP
jgi:hypothetical protein